MRYESNKPIKCWSRFVIIKGIRWKSTLDWLIDLIHRRKNCPTGMISRWVQKVTEHHGTILYVSLHRKGFLTRILLRIFTAHLTASKLYLSNQLEIVQQDLLMKRGYNESLDGVREDRKRAMFMLQESLAVQILIENCVTSSPSETAKMDFGLPEELTESQSAICTFIHRMVLTNPPLAKLVIFQGIHYNVTFCPYSIDCTKLIWGIWNTVNSIDRTLHGSIDWLIDLSMDGWIDWFVLRLIDWLICQWMDWLICWFFIFL